MAGLLRELVTFCLHRQGLIRSSGGERDAVRVLDELGALRDPLATAVLDTLYFGPRLTVPAKPAATARSSAAE